MVTTGFYKIEHLMVIKYFELVLKTVNTVEPGYNDIGLYRRPTNTVEPGYNDIGLYRRPTNTVEPGYNDIGL